MEKQKGLDQKAQIKHKDDYLFARKGRLNEWRKYFDLDDINYMNNYIDKTRLDTFNINYILKK